MADGTAGTSGTARTPEDVQREIEQARASLASTVDQLAERTSPKRLADEAKTTALHWAQSPRGKAILGGAAAAVALLVLLRVRAARRHDD